MADEKLTRLQEDAKFRLELGCEYPYDGRHPKDREHAIALGILCDLTDRKGVKWELQKVDDDVRVNIVDAMVEIIRYGQVMPEEIYTRYILDETEENVPQQG
jgi:hypothetical protein